MEKDLEIEKLKKEIEEFKLHNLDLQKQVVSKNDQYDCLEEEFLSLQNNYSENIIIQSMNEMKTRYDTMIKMTVPIHKYKSLNEKYEKLVKNYSGCSVLIEHIIKLMRSIEREIPYLRTDKKNILLKAELELMTVKEILGDSI